MQRLRIAQPFYCRYLFVRRGGDREDKGFDSSSVEVHGASTAQTRPTAKLGTLEFKVIAYDPEQWRIRVALEAYRVAIEREGNHG